jgi:hypothetical protein
VKPSASAVNVALVATLRRLLSQRVKILHGVPGSTRGGRDVAYLVSSPIVSEIKVDHGWKAGTLISPFLALSPLSVSFLPNWC